MRDKFTFRITRQDDTMFEVVKNISSRSVHRVMINLLRKYDAREVEYLSRELANVLPTR